MGAAVKGYRIVVWQVRAGPKRLAPPGVMNDVAIVGGVQAPIDVGWLVVVWRRLREGRDVEIVERLAKDTVDAGHRWKMGISGGHQHRLNEFAVFIQACGLLA